ncbi:hypothetical protein BUALT_Bualt14G0012800 [Buddleja alternifolia]|uniref:non-specific serine/threonine protein kinase n=1 Tax=Buddleja alternifolia TaxID=168488 RepID=A0AAV6WH88_9LAMI|nr:hypothetical protein BUALT_Bualt14G0012800 [Buddleja alternifolia]
MANSIIILSLLISSCFALIIPAAICSNNETDLHALLAFKDAIDPDSLVVSLNSWNEKRSHYCSWQGIQCSHRHRDRVIAINLMSRGLTGSLSPHLGNLSFLRSINLQNNNFHGQIPQEIGLLRRLEFAEFSSNSFVGTIPKNLSQCSNLYYLNLIENMLSGVIPHELGSLYKLQVLSLSKNNISGSIPPFVGNLTLLTRLSLGSCNLEGQIPQSLSRLKRLIFLQLADNNLIGRVPAGLFNISTLVTLGVDSNELEGTIPSDIGFTLPNLRNLYLADNGFSGVVPTSLSNVSSMEQLVLSLNYFTGKIPRVGRLLSLQDFLISNNNIQDDTSFISSLTNCTKLQQLDVGENRLLTGSLPESIANLSIHLFNMMIVNTQIHGNIPSGIGNLIGLTQIYLIGNNLEGPIPSSIGKLSNLYILRMEENNFSNELPSSFGNLTSLSYLSFARNNFSGSIPNSLSNCTNMLRLNLSRNNLDGLMPREVMNLSSLSISLDLSYNAFTGSIPLEIGSLTNLANLDLSNNRLSGLIPNTLSRCKSLQQLHLEGNSLQGEIPLELSHLEGLQDLDLSRNNFSGPIPSFLGKLHLENLNLSFNRLNGEVPIQGVFANKTAISLDGNKELCGGIRELKLPPCTSLNSSSKNLSSTLPKILIPIIIALLLCLIVIFLFKRIRMPKMTLSSALPSFIGTQFLRLSYSDLLKATCGFSENNLVGMGRFGSVYKGILDDGHTLVAVKVLNLVVKGACKSFLAECNALRGVRHRNLLKILSICESIDFHGNDFKALVYEFKVNGSLEKWLYRSTEQEEEENRNLNMIERLNIAIDIAHAVEYLHFGTDSTIVHGDLKPSNILLDQDMTAYVGDFGLAKIVTSILPAHDQSSSSIAIKGTVGYVAPEYGTNDLVSTQGDVYSYGILLLELFTNRRPTDIDSFENHVNLHSFVNNALPDRVMEIVDPVLSEIGPHEMDSNKMKDFMVSVLSIGVACSKEVPRDRMSMPDVVNQLHKIRDSMPEIPDEVGAIAQLLFPAMVAAKRWCEAPVNAPPGAVVDDSWRSVVPR